MSKEEVKGEVCGVRLTKKKIHKTKSCKQKIVVHF